MDSALDLNQLSTCPSCNKITKSSKDTKEDYT